MEWFWISHGCYWWGVFFGPFYDIASKTTQTSLLKYWTTWHFVGSVWLLFEKIIIENGVVSSCLTFLKLFLPSFLPLNLPNSHPLAELSASPDSYRRGCEVQHVLPLEKMEPAVISFGAAAQAASQDSWTSASTYMSSHMPTHWLTGERIIPSLPPRQQVQLHALGLLAVALNSWKTVAPLRSLYISFLAKQLLRGSFHYFNRTALSSQSITQPIITPTFLSACAGNQIWKHDTDVRLGEKTINWYKPLVFKQFSEIPRNLT